MDFSRSFRVYQRCWASPRCARRRGRRKRSRGRTATLSLSLFGVLPCCVFTLIGFAILSAWYGHGRLGEGACRSGLARGGRASDLHRRPPALGASRRRHMQGGPTRRIRGRRDHGRPRPGPQPESAADGIDGIDVPAPRRGRSSSPSSSKGLQPVVRRRTTSRPGAADRHGKKGKKGKSGQARQEREEREEREETLWLDSGAYAPALHAIRKQRSRPPTSASSDVTGEFTVDGPSPGRRNVKSVRFCDVVGEPGFGCQVYRLKPSARDPAAAVWNAAMASRTITSRARRGKTVWKSTSASGAR